MKNVTLSADDQLIQRARLRAAQQKTTLNAAFREWLQRYVGAENGGRQYEDLMERLRYANSGRRFSRDEMNER